MYFALQALGKSGITPQDTYLLCKVNIEQKTGGKVELDTSLILNYSQNSRIKIEMNEAFDMNSLVFPALDFKNLACLCRLCLNVNKKLFPLFTTDETDALAVSLRMKVSLCISISISKNDNLPQKICQKCLNCINDWYLFRKRAKKVHLFLKEKLESKKTNTEDQQLIETISDKTQSSNIEKDLNLSPNKTFVEREENKETIDSMVNNRKKYKCSLCPDSFYYLKDLKFHKSLLHSNAKPESPNTVSPIVESEVKLEGINMRTRYEMKCCSKVFFSRLKFRKHYTEKHPGEKPFMCETCGKKDFISEETLKRHKILHSGKFRCDICQKTFTCNAILKLHKRDKHENDKPFVCDVCGKRFVTELLMNYHKRFHTGEKKYVCEECGLAVVTSSSLAKHKRIHRQEKPHVCHICGKGFIIKGRLVEHLRVHTGERPYSCQICQKGFTIRDKLKRHMRVHSGEKLFSCEYCGNNYSTKYGLLGHLKTHLT